MAQSSVFSRRESNFLRTGVTGGAALCLLVPFVDRAFAARPAEQEKKLQIPPRGVGHITPDNRVTLILGNRKLGQGLDRLRPMILLSDETVAWDWKNLRWEQAAYQSEDL